VRAIRDGEAIHMVYEAAPNDAAFRYLKVPAEFFEAHLDDFATIRSADQSLRGSTRHLPSFVR
jgi:hypothetical protein